MKKIMTISNLNYKSFINFNLSFDCATFYSLVGANKTGKTTLFKIMSGLIVTNDVVECDDTILNNITRYDYIKNIGVVETVNSKSFKYQKVLDELIYPLHNLNYSITKSIQRIDYILDLFELDNIKNSLITELNYYDKQKLLIMIAILHKPKILLLDHVLNSFSSSECKKIIKVLKEIMIREDLTIINFTTCLEEVLESDYLMLLNNYQIKTIIKPKDLVDNDKLFYENNLEIPFITDLTSKLTMYNLVHQNYYDVKELVNDLWR